MGHALNGSIQDGLIRYAPHAGPRHEVDPRHRPRRHRDADPGRAPAALRGHEPRGSSGARRSSSASWQWREQYGGTIIEQYKRLGASCRLRRGALHARRRRTSRAVQKVFVDLYAKGLIYRDNYMVNWDPGSRSAISDLEVEEREVTDTLYYVDYPLASGHGSLTIATVRPETMLADTAIAVHPGRRALHAPGGGDGDPADRRPAAEDHRRPLRQAGVRHRRAEDHARPRPQRLRDRPRARARGDRR